jgi:hypothetical protein
MVERSGRDLGEMMFFLMEGKRDLNQEHKRHSRNVKNVPVMCLSKHDDLGENETRLQIIALCNPAKQSSLQPRTPEWEAMHPRYDF